MQWPKWREAIAAGEVAGSVWKGTKNWEHLHNQTIEIHKDKVGVAVGNKQGGVILEGYPDRIEIVYTDADGRVTGRETVAT